MPDQTVTRRFSLDFILTLHTGVPVIDAVQLEEQSKRLRHHMLGEGIKLASTARVKIAAETCLLLVRWQHPWLADVKSLSPDKDAREPQMIELRKLHGATLVIERLPPGTFDFNLTDLQRQVLAEMLADRT